MAAANDRRMSVQPFDRTITAPLAPFAPGFFGDFFNSVGNEITAPGSVVSNPDPKGDPYWTPLAEKLIASGDGSQIYYRSINVIHLDANNTTYIASNDYAYAPGTDFQSHHYRPANGLIAYQDGLALYNAASYDGNGAKYLSPSAFGGTPVDAHNIILVGSNSHVISGTQRDFSIQDALGKTQQNGQVPQEIQELVGFGTNVPLLKVVSVTPNQPLSAVTSNAASPGLAELRYIQGSANGLYGVPVYLATNAVNINVVSPSVGANGVQKLVDNSSPLPRDRLFFNYNYFSNTSEIINGKSTNVSRITPGFEKTFFDQRVSIEVRVPMATTVDSVNLTGVTNTNEIKLGNQTTYFKGIIFNNSEFAMTSGLGLQLPTAPGVDMYTTIQPGAPAFDVLQIKNEAIHILPFLGAVYTPNDRFYAQGVVQFDFAANGNPVNTAAIYPNFQVKDGSRQIYVPTTAGLQNTGSLNDTNFTYLSGNAGYWIYKVRNKFEKGITGIAPTLELHYNQSLQRSDVVAGAYGNVSSPVNNVSNVNGVIGINTVVGHDKFLSAAYAAPFTSGSNRFFDGELRVMFNYYFGTPRVNPRFSNVTPQ